MSVEFYSQLVTCLVNKTQIVNSHSTSNDIINNKIQYNDKNIKWWSDLRLLERSARSFWKVTGSWIGRQNERKLFLRTIWNDIGERERLDIRIGRKRELRNEVEKVHSENSRQLCKPETKLASCMQGNLVYIRSTVNSSQGLCYPAKRRPLGTS